MFDVSWHIRMLVGYSSSSEEESEAATATNESCPPKGQEEDDANDGCPARKKPKTKEQVPKTRWVCVEFSSSFL